MAAYATVAEYRTDTGDEATDGARIEAVLLQQSAKLRAQAGIDQQALCRLLVTDAARKCLVPPCIEGLGEMVGAKQGSFTANGFQGSATFANPSGSAYFDTSTYKALLKSLGKAQRMGYVWPGGGPC